MSYLRVVLYVATRLGDGEDDREVCALRRRDAYEWLKGPERSIRVQERAGQNRGVDESRYLRKPPSASTGHRDMDALDLYLLAEQSKPATLQADHS